jgi:hypothetical protein
VVGSKPGAELPGYAQERVVIGDKNLEVVTHLRELDRCTDEIWDGTRSPIPHKDVKAFSAQNFPDTVSDNPKADYPDVSFCSSRHGLEPPVPADRHLFSLKENAFDRNPQIYANLAIFKAEVQQRGQLRGLT